MKTKNQKSQRGLSLIELMIAITLSILIVSAMIGLFVNSKENYRMNENMSRLQENARFAVSFLASDLRMTDYRACVDADRDPDSLSGENVDPEDGSDTVTIIYQSNACGVGLSTVKTEYSIQDGQSGTPALFRNIDDAGARELVEGIENLQILYGLDTDDDNSPNKYTATPTAAEFAQAVSVRITLIAQTLESNLSADGQRISRSFTSTVTLRNRLP